VTSASAGPWRHALAVGLLPGTVAVLVPGLLVWQDGANPGWSLPLGWALLTALGGLALVAAGVGLFAWTVGLFARRGRGTLAPWDPTSSLVVSGPYLHVRNPMITGVGCVLAGEALLLGSPAIAVWLGIFAIVNGIYMPLVEEPGLVRRFGPAYETYRENVPRWVPRFSPWEPPASG